MSRTIIYGHVYIILVLGFPITYTDASVLLPIRMHMSTSNSKHGCFLNKQKMKIPTQKGKHSCKFTELSLKRKSE